MNTLDNFEKFLFRSDSILLKDSDVEGFLTYLSQREMDRLGIFRSLESELDERYLKYYHI